MIRLPESDRARPLVARVREPPVAQRTEQPPPKRVMMVRFRPGGRCENYIVFSLFRRGAIGSASDC